MIPSPYLFVPLAQKVFFPDWADFVSMDIPFEDGISGTIDITITAKTPIYIRNESDDNFFKTPDGKFAIPGTSVKGMLRSVIEIASFGKIIGTVKSPKVDDFKYAVRDLQNPSLYGKKFTSTSQNRYSSLVNAGWLQKNTNGNWVIIPCDHARVEQTELERHFKIKGPRNLGDRSSSSAKYGMIQPYTQVNFNCDPLKYHDHSRGNQLQYKKAANLGSGDTAGEVVLTGQPTPRGAPGRKHMEFIFFNCLTAAIPVSPDVKKSFEHAHTELGENRKPNTEWAFWKSRFDAGSRVPIFYLKDNIGNITSMGLAMMYRLPYANSIHDAIRHTSNEHIDNRYDMAELMFGRIEDKTALRGRVNIGLAVNTNNSIALPLQRTVLGSPKASFYPNYIKQNKDVANGWATTTFKTFMDNNCEISGRKRYIIRPDNNNIPQLTQATDNVSTSFRPLPASSEFKCKIHVHNLKAVELGALIWAITWGENDHLRHSIGMGKGLGFGSIKLSYKVNDLTYCKSNTVVKEEDIHNCVNDFTRKMDSFVNGNWIDSTQMKALTTIATPQNQGPEGMALRYPTLAGNNEFVDAKRNNNKYILYSFDPKNVHQPNPNPGNNNRQNYGAGNRQQPNQRHDNTGGGSTSGGLGGGGNIHVVTGGQLPATGTEVECVVLPEQTRNGGLKFKINAGPDNAKGVLSPRSNPLPADKQAPGTLVRLKVVVSAPNNMQFVVI